MNQMAAHGWVCVSANYRLSPHATFPEHIIDVKRAMAWIKEHVEEYGGDPDFIVVTGGSAGGHLAALMGLTANDPEFQPGFEDVDTSVQAAIPFYGVYDLLDRDGLRKDGGLGELLETKVMKGSIEEIPELYAKGSPVDRIHSEAPPFCIIHGGCDSLVPVEGARGFAQALASTSASQVVCAEIPGGQHAFEIFHSLRSQAVTDAAERFADWAYSAYLRRRRAGETPEELATTGEETGGASQASGESENAAQALGDAGEVSASEERRAEASAAKLKVVKPLAS
jgi:acetyl esterase/lipase